MRTEATTIKTTRGASIHLASHPCAQMDKYGNRTNHNNSSICSSPSALLVRNKNKRLGRLRKEMKRMANKKSNRRLQKEIATMQDLINNEFIRVGLHTNVDGVIVDNGGSINCNFGEDEEQSRGQCDTAADAAHEDEHVPHGNDEHDEDEDDGRNARDETDDCDHNNDNDDDEDVAVDHEEEIAILTKKLADAQLEARTYKHQLESSKEEVQVLQEKLKENKELVEAKEELTKALDMLSTFKILSGVQIGNKDEQIKLLQCQLQNQRDLCQIKDEKIVALYNARETLTRNHHAAIFMCQDIMASMAQEHGVSLEHSADAASAFTFTPGCPTSATSTPSKSILRSVVPNIVSP